MNVKKERNEEQERKEQENYHRISQPYNKHLETRH
jgi:hypothetical protein